MKFKLDIRLEKKKSRIIIFHNLKFNNIAISPLIREQ